MLHTVTYEHIYKIEKTFTFRLVMNAAQQDQRLSNLESNVHSLNPQIQQINNLHNEMTKYSRVLSFGFNHKFNYISADSYGGPRSRVCVSSTKNGKDHNYGC